MSSDDKFQRFIRGELSPSHPAQPGPSSSEPADEAGRRRTRPDVTLVGSTDYKPYGYRILGSDSCRLNWWDEERGDRRVGTSFHYRTLLRIGWDEIDPGSGLMMMYLFLADMNYQIDGYHLWPLIDRLSGYECAEMTVFSPRVHRAALKELLAQGETVLTKVQSSDGLLMTSKAVRN